MAHRIQKDAQKSVCRTYLLFVLEGSSVVLSLFLLSKLLGKGEK